MHILNLVLGSLSALLLIVYIVLTMLNTYDLKATLRRLEDKIDELEVVEEEEQVEAREPAGPPHL